MKKIILLSFLLLSGCSVNTGRYQQTHDSTPSRPPSPSELHDAIPRVEAKSRGGNRDYTVRGIHYKVLKNADNYQQNGIASYYGNKFHGHLTSNGEIFNMYSMSAAHKSLPLPSYVEVTNLANNKSVIVRVNDRGPFHQDRLIDLSYSAAYKLDMLKTGTTKVSVRIITPESSRKNKNSTITKKNNTNLLNKAKIIAPNSTPKTNTVLVPNKIPKGYFIQVFATNNMNKAKNTANALTALYQLPVSWADINGIFRVKIGPIHNYDDAEQLLINLRKNGYPQAFRRKSES